MTAKFDSLILLPLHNCMGAVNGGRIDGDRVGSSISRLREGGIRVVDNISGRFTDDTEGAGGAAGSVTGEKYKEKNNPMCFWPWQQLTLPEKCRRYHPAAWCGLFKFHPLSRS